MLSPLLAPSLISIQCLDRFPAPLPAASGLVKLSFQCPAMQGKLHIQLGPSQTLFSPPYHHHLPCQLPRHLLSSSWPSSIRWEVSLTPAFPLGGSNCIKMHRCIPIYRGKRTGAHLLHLYNTEDVQCTLCMQPRGGIAFKYIWPPGLTDIYCHWTGFVSVYMGIFVGWQKIASANWPVTLKCPFYVQCTMQMHAHTCDRPDLAGKKADGQARTFPGQLPASRVKAGWTFHIHTHCQMPLAGQFLVHKIPFSVQCGLHCCYSKAFILTNLNVAIRIYMILSSILQVPWLGFKPIMAMPEFWELLKLDQVHLACQTQ